MTPTALAAHERHARFHAEIARRSALVPQRQERTYCIPNTPFGVKKVQPVHKPRYAVPPKNIEPDWWHCMWFFDLVRDQSTLVRPTVKRIQIAVGLEFGASLEDMISPGRTKDVVLPRQIAMFLCKHLLSTSLPELGRRFGGRDHTTALHAVQKIRRAIQQDSELKERIAAVARSLGRSL